MPSVCYFAFVGRSSSPKARPLSVIYVQNRMAEAARAQARRAELAALEPEPEPELERPEVSAALGSDELLMAVGRAEERQPEEGSMELSAPPESLGRDHWRVVRAPARGEDRARSRS